MDGMKAALAALVALVLLAACSSGAHATNAAAHLTRHTTCRQWTAWSKPVRLQAAATLARSLGALNTGAAFRKNFELGVSIYCTVRLDQPVQRVAAQVAAVSPADFSG